MRVAKTLTRNTRRLLRAVRLADDGRDRAMRAIEALLDGPARDLFARAGVPGMSIAVDCGGGRLVRRCFGVHDLQTREPITDDTVFQVCSISKVVAAGCALAMADRGLLTLDGPIWSKLTSWVMPLDRRGGFDIDQVTLRCLLSHSAGVNIHSPGWAPPPSPNHEGKRSALAQLVDGLDGPNGCDPDRQLRLIHPAGTMVYSGGGYLLLEQLIQDASGMSFDEAARAFVLEPLGMRASGFAPTPELLKHLATRHDDQNRALPRARLSVDAASGLYTTATDLVRFMSSVWLTGSGPRVLSDESRRAMLRVQSRGPCEPPIAGRERLCGLGFQLWPQTLDMQYAHAGFQQGWWGWSLGLAKRQVAFVILTNGDRGSICGRDLVNQIRDLLNELVLEVRPARSEERE